MSKKATPAQWYSILPVLQIMDIDAVDRQPYGAELPLSCTNPNARALVPLGPVRSIVEGGWTVVPNIEELFSDDSGSDEEVRCSPGDWSGEASGLDLSPLQPINCWSPAQTPKPKSIETPSHGSDIKITLLQAPKKKLKPSKPLTEPCENPFEDPDLLASLAAPPLPHSCQGIHNRCKQGHIDAQEAGAEKRKPMKAMKAMQAMKAMKAVAKEPKIISMKPMKAVSTEPLEAMPAIKQTSSIQCL